MKEYNLQKIRTEKLRVTLKQMSTRTGISEGQLSKIETGKTWPARKNDALGIARAYQLDETRVLKDYILHNEPQEVREVMAGLFSSTTKADLSASELKAMHRLRCLSPNRNLHRAFVSILSTLVDVNNCWLKPTSRVCEVIENPFDDTGYTPIGPAERIQHRLLYASKSGTPFVVELHRFPIGYAGYHRAANITNTNPLELWCVISGAGLLVLRDDPSGFQTKRVKAGACGYNQGAVDHIWQNDSDKEDLIMFCAFYPYLGPVVPKARYRNVKKKLMLSTAEGEVANPPVATEFRIGESPKSVPNDILGALREATSLRSEQDS